MLRQLVARIRQGYRTMPYPKGTPVLPDRFRGKPEIDRSVCAADCRACVDACPTSAVTFDDDGAILDLGRCLFCADCAAACPSGALRFTGEHRLAAWGGEDLLLRSPQPAHAEPLRRLRRSLKSETVISAPTMAQYSSQAASYGRLRLGAFVPVAEPDLSCCDS